MLNTGYFQSLQTFALGSHGTDTSDGAAGAVKLPFNLTLQHSRYHLAYSYTNANTTVNKQKQKVTKYITVLKCRFLFLVLVIKQLLLERLSTLEMDHLPNPNVRKLIFKLRDQT